LSPKDTQPGGKRKKKHGQARERGGIKRWSKPRQKKKISVILLQDPKPWGTSPRMWGA